MPKFPHPPFKSKVRLKKLLHNRVLVLLDQLPNIALGEPLAANPAELADLLYETRAARLLLQKVCTELDEQETACENWFINNLAKSNATGIAGKVGRVTTEAASIPVVKDWTAFYEHILKTKSFELLNKALNRKAVTERWEDKKEVPGVEHFGIVKVSCVKAGKR